MKSQWIGFQSILAHDIQNFLTHKRALRRRYDVEEMSLRLLDQHLAQQDMKDSSDVTPDIIENFLASRPRQRPRSYNHLLCTVRRLFDWMVGQGILKSSPVRTKPRRQTSQRVPFIFDLQAARRLLEVAQRLPERSKAPMRGKTYHAILAILYGLGLRVSEVCHLQIQDVDFNQRLLVIRQTKFYKSRLVPFGPKMEALLREYLQARSQRLGALSPEVPFFSFTNRGEIHPGTVSQTFHHLIPQLELEIPPGCLSPHLHDLRHSFAVGTLIRWYRTGADPGAGLLKLSTFLGHVDVNSTAVYLTMTATLLQEANRRFETFVSPIVTEGLHQ